MMFAASTFRTVAWVLAVLGLIGWVVYYWFNVRGNRAEIGAEVELAANRSEPVPDETLEGTRLEQVQFLGVVFLLIIAVGLPLYWLREPGRQEAATNGWSERFASWGEDLYNEGFQCNTCHGADGVGGVAPYLLPVPLRDADGEFVLNEDGSIRTYNVQTAWTAPALDDIFLRYSEEEVREILIYGRTNSPMPAWGVEGGGSGNEQQIQNVIDYLWSIQKSSEEVIEANTEVLERARQQAADAGEDFDEGEYLFNQHCARCHTQGWSWAANFTAEELAAIEDELDQVAPGTDLPIGEPGGGAFGPRLAAENLAEQFLTVDDMVSFITAGADENVSYGTRGLGGGQMPGFGGTLTEEQIRAIVEYERGLQNEDEGPDA